MTNNVLKECRQELDKWFRRYFNRVFKTTEEADIPRFDKERIRYFFFIIVLGVPIMFLYGVYNLLQGNRVLSLGIFITAFTLSAGLRTLLRHSEDKGSFF